MGAERRVVLLRHAKSAYPVGVPDHGRPLAGKGRRNAQATGRWFVSEGPRVGLVLCSDATRARHTWEIVRSELVRARLDAPVRLVRELYGAAPGEVLDLVRGLSPDVGCVVVVGHEPTMSSTTLLLAGDDSDPRLVGRVEGKFATNAVAVLRWAGDWPDLAPGGAVLEAFVKPRA